MIASIHACVDLLHVGYRVKEEYDPIILNVFMTWMKHKFVHILHMCLKKKSMYLTF